MSYVKSLGALAAAVVCLFLTSGNAMARGAGQGEHEADSGGGYGYYGGGSFGGGGGGSAGQGQNGPGGSTGAYVASGIDSSAVGQAQHGGGGSGFYQGAPAFESSPLVGPTTLIAAQPATGSSVAVDSRYRFANSTWFYQLPNDRWVRWDDGDWVDYSTSALAPQNSGPVEHKAVTDSRYSFASGTWYYQLPDDRWVRWENGAWVDNNIAATTQQAPESVAGSPVPLIRR